MRYRYLALGLLNGCVFWHLGDDGEAANGGNGSSSGGGGAVAHSTGGSGGSGGISAGSSGGGGAAAGGAWTLDNPLPLQGERVDGLIGLGPLDQHVFVWTSLGVERASEHFLHAVVDYKTKGSSYTVPTTTQVLGVGRTARTCEVYVTRVDKPTPMRRSPAPILSRTDACESPLIVMDVTVDVPPFLELRPAADGWAAWTSARTLVDSDDPMMSITPSDTVDERAKVELGHSRAFFARSDSPAVLDWQDFDGSTGGLLIDFDVVRVATKPGPSEGFAVCIKENLVACRLAIGLEPAIGPAPLRLGPRVEELQALALDGDYVYVATSEKLEVYAQAGFSAQSVPTQPLPAPATLASVYDVPMSGITQLLPTPDSLYFGYSEAGKAKINRLAIGSP
jgi:hypothetical protein